jgi:DNA-binding NtrC family response regulator
MSLGSKISLNVLIADATASAPETIIQALKPWEGGVTWSQASSGEETRDFLLNQNPDIAFVDVTGLKGMSGPEAVALARKAGNRSMVVLMSSLVLPQWVALATEAGAYEFIRKPLNPPDITQLINSFTVMKKASRVLLVEPSPIARQILRRMMGEAVFNLEIEETDNGSHALKLLNISQYDVAFVDMHLPGMGGLEVACQMQSRNEDLAVVLMSGQKNSTLSSMAEKFGIGYYLHKPFFNLDLNVVLHNALKLRRPYLLNALMRAQEQKREEAQKEEQKKALLTGS